MRKSDIYFAADDAQKFLPWLIGIMVFLATLFLCLGVSVNSWIIDRSAIYSDSFTVNIPAATKNINEKLPDIIQSLKSIEGVESVNRVSDNELQEMLKPWLGENIAIADLPVPVILEVVLADNAIGRVDYNVVQQNLQAIAPGAEVDAHELWVAAFSSFSRAIQSMTFILAVLIMTGMGLMISFSSRAALKLHSRTVNLLHSIGAEDRYISRLFQMEALKLLMPAAFIGCVAAGLSYTFTGFYVASLNMSVIPPLVLTNWHYVLLIAVPFACTLLAWFVARVSVIQQLERSL